MTPFDCLADLARSGVRVGTDSWADRGLVQSQVLYPRKSMDASQRLGFYSSTFSVCEVTTTFRYPPSADVTSRWVQRSAEGFRFDVSAWSLLTGCPTVPDSLWPDLQGSVIPRFKDSRQLYAAHLPADVVEECWERFVHSIRPLIQAGRLGAVLLRYPRWFSPRRQNLDAIEKAVAHLGGAAVAVELPSTRWYPSSDQEGFLEWLDDRNVALVCTATPSGDPRGVARRVACTSDLAFVRFAGTHGTASRQWRSAHLYSPAELEGWVGTLSDLAGSASETHIVMGNGPGSAPVVNAYQLACMLQGGPASRCRPAPEGRSVPAPRAKAYGRSSRLTSVETTWIAVRGPSKMKLAVHRLGGDGPPLMLAHATGFHGRCWAPVAEQLTDRFSVWALDQAGHGSSDRPADGRFEWELLASDLLEVIDFLGGDGWRIGGHSLGGGVALLAEAARPGTFDSICCYEPVVVPPWARDPEGTPPAAAEATQTQGPGQTRTSVSLATLARKRRATFDSRSAALANYRSKPPFAEFSPSCLELYVEYGFVDNADGSVSLACQPDDEAAVFDMAPASPTWNLLGSIQAPVTVFAGKRGDDPVGSWAETIASRIPKGRFRSFESLDHFGPMTAPGEVGRAFAESF